MWQCHYQGAGIVSLKAERASLHSRMGILGALPCTTMGVPGAWWALALARWPGEFATAVRYTVITLGRQKLRDIHEIRVHTITRDQEKPKHVYTVL